MTEPVADQVLPAEFDAWHLNVYPLIDRVIFHDNTDAPEGDWYEMLYADEAVTFVVPWSVMQQTHTIFCDSGGVTWHQSSENQKR